MIAYMDKTIKLKDNPNIFLTDKIRFTHGEI